MPLRIELTLTAHRSFCQDSHTTMGIGLIWNIGYMAAARVLGLAAQGLATVVLARYLTAADYGVIGYATVFLAFLNLFQDAGLQGAAVQASEFSERARATAFWMKLTLSATLAICGMIAAPLTLVAFDDPGAASVIRALSLCYLLTSVAFVPSILLLRDLNYRAISLVQALSALAGSSCSIVMAMIGSGYWSIVVGSIVWNLVLMLASMRLRPYWPRLEFDRGVARGFWGYGLGLSSANLVVFALFNADNLLIGAILGATQLGYYALAFNWGSLVASTLCGVVGGVLFPTFSRLNRDEMRRIYIRSVRYSLAAGMLANVTLAVAAPSLLISVLGRGTDKWLPALGPLYVLCLYGVLRVTLEPLGSVVVAVGKPGAMLRPNVIVAVIQIAALYPALRLGGITAAAVVVLVSYALQYPLYSRFLREELNVRWADVFQLKGWTSDFPSLRGLLAARRR
ncbi:MAG TPA: lipopolysaccharide biosynthesis protein [Methylomirabilota bacterium]|nr:lipopolysaccharide biosynthesis protein [Methylomirabilota bacterium]